MTKITDPAYLRLPNDARAFADGFLAVAKPYTATEVARVLTDLRGGVNYMGCGKTHCAASYAEAKMGKRAGLQSGENKLAALTMNQFRELLAIERNRLEDGRQSKVDNEARWKRERDERLARQEQRALAADRWEAETSFCHAVLPPNRQLAARGGRLLRRNGVTVSADRLIDL